MSVDLDGVMLIRWVRGPRTATSMEAEGKHGVFKWKKDEQNRKPTRMISTLYKNRGLGEYQRKKSLLVVKQRIGDTLLTVGEVELDLANFVTSSGESTSRVMNEAIHKCSDKKARVKFTITSRDITKQHVDTETEVSGFGGGLDDEEDYYDPDGRADYGTLELAQGDLALESEDEPEEPAPVETQAPVPLVPKPQILSFASPTEGPQESEPLDPPGPTLMLPPKAVEPKSTKDEGDPQLQTKVRELETKLWKLSKHSEKVEKELITTRDQYAKHLEKLEKAVADTTANLESKEKQNNELSHKLEATALDLERETARARSFARLLDMQRSQIEAAEAEATTFQARAGELQRRLNLTEASLAGLTEQKHGMMAQFTSSKRVKELEELVAAKDQSIKFYEAQLESSDKTMISSKEAWDNSSRLLLQEIGSAEAAFKKTKELLEEATSEADHFSDVEKQYKRAIADRLKLSELVTQYECTIAQKNLELQQLQLQLTTKSSDGMNKMLLQTNQSRESSLRVIESPAMSPAYVRSVDTTPLVSPTVGPSNPFADEPTVIHMGPVGLSLGVPPSAFPSAFPSSFSSSPALMITLAQSSSSSLNPIGISSSSSSSSSSSCTETVSSQPSSSTNPFELSTNPFDSLKPDQPRGSSSTNPFESTSEPPPSSTVSTNTMTSSSSTAPATLSSSSSTNSLTSSLTSSFNSLFRKSSRAASTGNAVAAALGSGTSPLISSTNAPPANSSSSPQGTPNLSSDRAAESGLPGLNLKSNSDSPSCTQEVETEPRPDPPSRTSSSGPRADLSRSPPRQQRHISEDFGNSLAKMLEDTAASPPPPELSKSPKSSRSLGIFFATSSSETAPSSQPASDARSPKWASSRGLLFSSTDPKSFEVLPAAAETARSPTLGHRSLASISEQGDLVDSKPPTRSTSSSSTEETTPTRSASAPDLAAHFVQQSESFTPPLTSFNSKTTSDPRRKMIRAPPPPPSNFSPPKMPVPVLSDGAKEEQFEEF